jgi:hypothetical protein
MLTTILVALGAGLLWLLWSALDEGIAELGRDLLRPLRDAIERRFTRHPRALLLAPVAIALGLVAGGLWLFLTRDRQPDPEGRRAALGFAGLLVALLALSVLFWLGDLWMRRGAADHRRPRSRSGDST